MTEPSIPALYSKDGDIEQKCIGQPEACASNIFEASGAAFDAEVAIELWQKIMRHKQVQSEKLPCSYN